MQPLKRISDKLADLYYKSRVVNEYATIDALRIYAPNSFGRGRAMLNSTLLSAQQTLPSLLNLLESIGLSLPLEMTSDEYAATTDVAFIHRLANILTKHGSDKSTYHDYEKVYAPILESRPIQTLLEIGLGTPHQDVMSSMGPTGRPGASLRAFRELLPSASLFGADVDRRILFSEERIETFFVDQTDLHSLQSLFSSLPEALDLIIDDGLHSPHANLNVLACGIHQLSVGGYLVVEDIHHASLPVWKAVATILPTHYQTRLVNARHGHMFVVRRT